MTRARLIAECKRRYESGEDAEQLIAFLRSSGCSKIESIAVIASACGVGLGRAKEMVHLSPTWDDRRTSDDEFHAAIEDEISVIKSADKN